MLESEVMRTGALVTPLSLANLEFACIRESCSALPIDSLSYCFSCCWSLFYFHTVFVVSKRTHLLKEMHSMANIPCNGMAVAFLAGSSGCDILCRKPL